MVVKKVLKRRILPHMMLFHGAQQLFAIYEKFSLSICYATVQNLFLIPFSSAAYFKSILGSREIRAVFTGPRLRLWNLPNRMSLKY